MTGTNRANNPAAQHRDKQSDDPAASKVPKKGGAGPHNWGSDLDDARDQLAANAAEGDDPVARAQDPDAPGREPSKGEQAKLGEALDAVGETSNISGVQSGAVEIARDALTNA